MITYITQEVVKQGWEKVEDRFIYLDEHVYFNKAGRDSDNLKKLTQDCITESGVVWKDDTYCLSRTQRVLIDKNNPRLEITLSIAEYIGIFDNEAQLQEFKQQCEKCKRYTRNCSILREALENRVQKEINGLICEKFKEDK